jgi:hypothetical protein
MDHPFRERQPPLTLNLAKRSCTCYRFPEHQTPCGRVVSVMQRLNVAPVDFIFSYFNCPVGLPIPVPINKHGENSPPRTGSQYAELKRGTDPVASSCTVWFFLQAQ